MKASTKKEIAEMSRAIEVMQKRLLEIDRGIVSELKSAKSRAKVDRLNDELNHVATAAYGLRASQDGLFILGRT